MDRVIQALPVDELGGPFEVLVLDLQGTELAAVGKLDLLGAGHVVADLTNGPDRVLKRQVAHRHPGLDHPQHQIR